MADNVNVTPGSGAQVATDEVTGTGEHVQVIKLAYGGNGLRTAIPADADGLLVNLGLNNDVVVSSITPGTAAANLGKAEDAAHTTGDTGVMALAVRTDVAAARAATDGDYVPLITDSSGRLHVNVGSMPAASRATDSISTAQMSDVIMTDLTALTPLRSIIAAASSGDNTVIAAQGAGNAIRIHSVFLMAAASVNVRFESGAGGTAMTGVIPLAANVGFVLPFSPIPWMVTADNVLLNLELSAAQSVAGLLVYTVN